MIPYLCRIHILLIGVFLLSFFSSISFAVSPESSEKRIALVIGNSSYRNTPALLNPKNDALIIGQTLKRLGFDADVLTDLTKSEMDKALRRFGERLEGAKTSVFYYAGHGIQVNGVNYLLPVDAVLKHPRDLEWESSSMTSVLRQMEGKDRVNILFLDACRDNPLSETLARSMGDNRSVFIGRGLARVDANAGTLISYATKEGEVASDGKGDHSPYTQALLKHIETPGLEVGIMLRRVREQVRKSTAEKQTPWEYGSLLGEFYFNAPVTIQIQEPPPVQQSNAELLYWQSIMNDTQPAAFEAYLKRYPNGEFSELARIKMEKLKNLGTNPSPAESKPDKGKEQTKTGDIQIDSDPSGAAVLMNGENIGTTHLEISGIEPGNKKLELKKPCFETWTGDVSIQPGRKVKISPRLKASCGRLKVGSTPPQAEVRLNDKMVGATPLDLDGVEAGIHRVSIQSSGYEEWNGSIQVRPLQTAEVKTVKLKAVPEPVSQPPVSATSPQIKVQPEVSVTPPALEKTPDTQATVQPESVKPSIVQPTINEHAGKISSDGYLTQNLVENFSGSTLNSILWKDYNSNKGEAAIKRSINDGLILHAAKENKVWGGIWSKFKLKGDFEVIVDIDLNKWSQSVIWGETQKSREFRLTLSDDKKNGFEIFEQFYKLSDGFEGYQMCVRNEESLKDYKHFKKPDIEPFGKLKIIRKNGIISGYYFSKTKTSLFGNSDWKLILEYPNKIDVPLYVNLILSNSWTEKQYQPSEVEVKITKITINLQ